MATPRPASTDFLHSMRFQVSSANGRLPGQVPSADDGRPEAGFSACTTPSITVEAVEYREGTFVYARKQPGLPTLEDVTLQRGVTSPDTTFWGWMRIVVEGTAAPGDYRDNLIIKHFDRVNALNKGVAPGPTPNAAAFISTDKPARSYVLYNAFPTTHKVAGDLDATASEISIMELGVAYEYFEILIGP